MLNLSVRTARLRHDLAGDTLQYSDKLFRARLGISNLATGEARDFVKILNNTQNSLTSNPFLGLFSITRDCRRFFVCKKEWPAVYFFKPSKPRWPPQGPGGRRPVFLTTVGPSAREALQSYNFFSPQLFEVGYLSRFIPSLRPKGRFLGLKNSLVAGSILGSHSSSNRLKFPERPPLLSFRAWRAAPAGSGSKVGAGVLRSYLASSSSTLGAIPFGVAISALDPESLRKDWIAIVTNPSASAKSLKDWNPWAISACSEQAKGSFGSEKPNYSWKYWRAYDPEVFIPGMESSWYKAYPGLDHTVNLINNCLRYKRMPESLLYLGNKSNSGPSDFLRLKVFISSLWDQRAYLVPNACNLITKVCISLLIICLFFRWLFCFLCWELGELFVCFSVWYFCFFFFFAGWTVLLGMCIFILSWLAARLLICVAFLYAVVFFTGCAVLAVLWLFLLFLFFIFVCFCFVEFYFYYYN